MEENETKLSGELKDIINQIGKFQAKVNAEGYEIDFESVMINLEGHVSSLEYYENNK